ncbi:MAG: nuclear transport factor 2 family protein [Crocosphaera sp.]|nr:nuclear transport factor 2 family protein [Crocosphaera sp.]
MDTIDGQKFFEEHINYLTTGDVEGMVNNTYTEDAILYNAFPCLDTPPPNVIKGREELIKLFKTYLAYQGEIQVDSLDNFLVTEDVISFQGTITSPKTGKWVVADIWLMDAGQIARHFGVAHRLGDA